jgi:hypothetical protein
MSSEHLLVSSEHLLMSSEHLLVSSEHLLMSSEHLLVSSEHLLMSSEHLLVSSEHLSVSVSPRPAHRPPLQLAAHQPREQALAVSVRERYESRGAAPPVQARRRAQARHRRGTGGAQAGLEALRPAAGEASIRVPAGRSRGRSRVPAQAWLACQAMLPPLLLPLAP